MTRIAVLGGGPGGYEAALVATELGADVVVIDRDGLGGACVLTDCVPSKTLIATSDLLTGLGSAGALGVRLPGAGLPHESAIPWDPGSGLCPPDLIDVDATSVFGRVKALALSQSVDIAHRLVREGVYNSLARDWLSQRDVPVSEVAARLDFSDSFAFRRFFRRLNGVPPSSLGAVDRHAVPRSRELAPKSAGRNQIATRKTSLRKLENDT